MEIWKRCGRGGSAKALYEGVRGRLAAPAQGEIQNEFRLPLDGYEAVGVADGVVILFRWQLVSFLFLDVTPDLVALNVRHGNVDDHAAHQLLALLASNRQDFENRSMVHAGDALDRVDGASLHQEFQYLFGAVDLGVHAAERRVVRLREGALAVGTLVARESVAVFAELPADGVTRTARHCGLAFFGQKRQNDSGFANPAFGASPRLSLAGSSNYQRGVLLNCLRFFCCGSLRERPPISLGIIGRDYFFYFAGCYKPLEHGVNLGHGIRPAFEVELISCQQIPHELGSKRFCRIGVEESAYAICHSQLRDDPSFQIGVGDIARVVLFAEDLAGQFKSLSLCVDFGNCVLVIRFDFSLLNVQIRERLVENAKRMFRIVKEVRRFSHA